MKIAHGDGFVCNFAVDICTVIVIVVLLTKLSRVTIVLSFGGVKPISMCCSMLKSMSREKN